MLNKHVAHMEEVRVLRHARRRFGKLLPLKDKLELIPLMGALKVQFKHNNLIMGIVASTP